MTRLLAYIRVILRWRKLIFYNTLAITLLAVGISFILPQRFTAVARLLPPSQDDGLGLSSLLGGGFGGGGKLSRLAAGALLGYSTPSDLMVGVMRSRTVMQNVVDQCSIIGYYRIKRGSMDDALKVLAKMTSIEVTDEGIISVSIEAKTRLLAAKTANCYLDELDRFLRSSNMSRGRNMRVFIEKRLFEVERSMAQAQESLEVFQQRKRTVALDEESKAAVDAYATLMSQLYVKQAELAMLDGLSGPANPYTAALREQVDAFRAQLRQLEDGSGGTGFGVGFAVSFKDLPAVAAEFIRRYRDFKIQEESYGLLYEQYEYARILEARDSPAVTVLDHASPPERRSFPRRWLIALIGLLFSLAASLCFAFVSEYFSALRLSKPSEYEGWVTLASALTAIVHRRRPNKCNQLPDE